MASFLAPMLRSPGQRFVLRNERPRQIIATRLEPAFDSASRRKGLLGRTSYERGSALIIAPCSSVHTFFMQMVLDVVFVSRQGRVLKTYPALPARRIAFALGAFAAIELPAGTIERSNVRRGDEVVLVPE